MTTLKMSLPTKSLVIPVGLPGSGKSTLLRGIEERYGLAGFRYGADDVRKTMFGDVSTQGNPALVHGAARAMLEVRMAEGLPSTYDATNLTLKARRPLIELCGKYEYTAVLLMARISYDTAQSRNRGREEGRVPGHVLDRMNRQLNDGEWKKACQQGRSGIPYFFDEDTTDIEVDWLA